MPGLCFLLRLCPSQGCLVGGPLVNSGGPLFVLLTHLPFPAKVVVDSKHGQTSTKGEKVDSKIYGSYWFIARRQGATKVIVSRKWVNQSVLVEEAGDIVTITQITGTLSVDVCPLIRRANGSWEATLGDDETVLFSSPNGERVYVFSEDESLAQAVMEDMRSGKILRVMSALMLEV